jgi:hypothetical protein
MTPRWFTARPVIQLQSIAPLYHEREPPVTPTHQPEGLTFAPEYDQPVRYIERTRSWPAGRPQDPQSQATTLEWALRLLESAPGPRTTLQSPLRWIESAAWKLDYCNAEKLTADEIRRRREEWNQARTEARAVRQMGSDL